MRAVEVLHTYHSIFGICTAEIVHESPLRLTPKTRMSTEQPMLVKSDIVYSYQRTSFERHTIVQKPSSHPPFPISGATRERFSSLQSKIPVHWLPVCVQKVIWTYKGGQYTVRDLYSRGL